MTNWLDLTRCDLDAMRDEILASHPGPVDADNPTFAEWLKEGHAKAQALTDRVCDETGWRAALRFYVAGFRDGHLALSGLGPDSAPPRWPGFRIDGRFGRLMVVASSVANVAVGDEIVGVPGEDLAHILDEQVFAFAGEPRLPASWDRVVHRLLLDDGNPFAPPLKAVTVLGPAGTREVDLTWRPLSPEDHVAYWSAPLRQTDRRVHGDVHWISLPTFDPGGKNGDALRALMTDIRAHAEVLRTSRAIVIDLVDNDGGSSGWADELCTALWGEAHYTAAMAGAPRSTVDWRVSEGNMAHVARWIAPGSGLHASMRAWAEDVHAGLIHARNEGRPFFTQAPEPAAAPVEAAASPMHAPVFVLQSGSASAGLDAMDRLKRLANITFFGLPTLADSQYMEVRQVSLPSGLAKLVVPIKVYRDRPRAPGQAYQPDILYAGLDRSHSALQSWALGMIGQRLAR